MDLFGLTGTMWQHKRATIPVILLTLLGAFYVVAVKAPTYQAKASILLSNPPAPPTAAQIAANPGLGRVNTNNPFTSLGSLDFVADVVIEVVTADAAKQALVQEGANPNYQVIIDPSLGSPPAINVTGVGSTAQIAIRSAQLVAMAISKDLHQLQVDQNVDSKYMVSSIEYIKPTSASSSKSSKLRTMIEVVAAGFILLLVAVSVSQGLAERKGGRKSRRRKSASSTGGDYEPVRSPSAETYDRSQWLPERIGESRPGSSVRRPGMEPTSGSSYWHENG